MNKKGQMTILIILGLAIVSSVILLYVFRDQLFQSEFDKLKSESLTVPAQAEEMHAHLSDCVRDTIEQPVNLVGIQGGYIELPEDPIGKGDHNEFSNSLEIFSGADLETAYWFYIAANGVQKTQVPTIEEIENSLEIYVNDNLADCVNDFELFEDNNATAGEIDTEVNILDDEVQFVVNYPVHIDLEDFEFDFDAFYENIDVPLGEMYNTAIEIMDEENERFFLEELTYDMFVLYEELPFSDADLECETRTWSKTQVEEDLKDIIFNNILAVKVKGSSYEVSKKTDENYFEWEVLDSSNDFGINMMYSPSWPLDMKVYPTEGDTMVEDSFTGSGFGSYLQSLFCLRTSNFIYDLKYPVLVSLYDKESDYTFQFATMVVLDNNQPRENEVDEDIPEVGGVVCDSASVPVTVYAVSVAENGDLVEMEDVDVSFKCINNVCSLGNTEGSEGSARLDAIVPQCLNGQIVVEKNGYADGVEVFDSLDATTVTVVLEKYYNLSYDIVIIDEDGNEKDPESEDVVMVTLTEEDGYSVTVAYPETNGRVVLIPGTYTVSGTLVTDAPFDIIIPESSYTSCTSVPLLSLGGLFGYESDADCVDVDIAETELENTLAGGVDLTWKVDRDELASASHVTFYVTSPGSPDNLEDMESVYAYLDTRLGLREPELE